MGCETKINNKNFIVLRTLAVLLALFFSLNFWHKAAALEKPEETQTSVQQTPDTRFKTGLPPVEILQKISQAQADGKYVFILFYEDGNSDCDIMAQRLDEYARNNGEKVEIVKIDRKNPENSTLVASMRAQTASVPLTLVKDPKNQIVMVFKALASEEEIRYAIPSPKKIEAMTSMQEGKSLIFYFTSKTMPSGNKIEQSCEEAIKKLEGKAVYIKVDVTDPKEEGFLKEMKINRDISEPVAIVINSRRQLAGAYTGEVKADDLVLAATKIASGGGCCPAGSGKSCGPTR